MPKQREGGVTLRIASNGGEVDWLARDLLQVSTGEALKFLSLTKSNQSVRQVLTGDNPCLGQHHVGAELIRRVLRPSHHGDVEDVEQGVTHLAAMPLPVPVGPRGLVASGRCSGNDAVSSRARGRFRY